METQFQISKRSSSNTKSNGNSVPNFKRKLQQYYIKWKPSSKSQTEAPAILNQMETQFQISKGSSSNTKLNGNSSLPILNQMETHFTWISRYYSRYPHRWGGPPLTPFGHYAFTQVKGMPAPCGLQFLPNIAGGAGPGSGAEEEANCCRCALLGSMPDGFNGAFAAIYRKSSQRAKAVSRFMLADVAKLPRPDSSQFVTGLCHDRAASPTGRLPLRVLAPTHPPGARTLGIGVVKDHNKLAMANTSLCLAS